MIFVTTAKHMVISIIKGIYKIKPAQDVKKSVNNVTQIITLMETIIVKIYLKIVNLQTKKVNAQNVTLVIILTKT